MRPGADLDKAAAQFAKAFKVEEDRARGLIEGNKRIGNGVTRERAEKYLEVLGKIGVEATVNPPLAAPEAVVGDDDVDESAKTIVQLPGQGLAPVADPDGPDDDVDENAATVMIASPVPDPDAAPAASGPPDDPDVDPNAATVIAASPIADPDPDAAAGEEDVDPNAATVIAVSPVRDPDAPAEPKAAAEPDPEPEPEPPKGLFAKLKALFGRG